MPVLRKGSFVARGELWFYRKVDQCDLLAIGDYLREYPDVHNDGVYQAEKLIQKKFNDGFYDQSYVIFDSAGVLNSAAIMWGAEDKGRLKSMWGSGLYLEGSRTTAALMFLPSFMFEVLDRNVFFFEGAVPVFNDAYNANGFPCSEWKDYEDDQHPNYFIHKGMLDPNTCYKFGEIKRDFYER